MKLATLLLSGATAGLLGCATPRPWTLSAPVGPAPNESARSPGASSLQVYSARERAPADVHKEEFLWNNDFGRNEFLYEPAHTDYVVLSADGRVLYRVRNADGPNDAEPAVLTLPPGNYQVQAQARDLGLVNVPVVIEAGQQTTVNLQRFRQSAEGSAPNRDLVRLPDGRVVGWPALAAAPAGSP